MISARIPALSRSPGKSVRSQRSAFLLILALAVLAAMHAPLAAAQSTPTLTLTTSADPAADSNMPTFTATVSGASGGPVPTGMVVFEVFEEESRTATLDSSGAATFIPNTLTPGQYGVIATYNGDSNYSAGISNDIFETIISAPGALISGNANFSPTSLGVSSSAATFTLHFAQAETLGNLAVLTQGVPAQDFIKASGGSCVTGNGYAANATCTVNVKFSPKAPGTRYGAVVVSDSGGNVIGTGYLQGTGIGPLVTFRTSGTSDDPLGPIVNIETDFAPIGVAVDAAGNVYSAGNGLLQKWTPQSDGTYTATSIGMGGINPDSVAIDGAGNLYVADTSNVDLPYVYKGVRSNGAYTWTSIGYGLSNLVTAAVDGGGNLYVADAGQGSPNLNPCVYIETLQPDGSYAQSLLNSSFVSPSGVAVDGSGDVYVSDNGFLSPPGAVYQEAPSSGNYVQTTVGSNWNEPTGVMVDGLNSVYVAVMGPNPGNGVYRETPQSGGYTQSTINYGPLEVYGMAADGRGAFYYGRYQTNVFYEALTKLDYAAVPSESFGAEPQGSTDPNAVLTVPLTNSGNANLTISTISFPADFPGISLGTIPCSSGTTLSPGETCTLGINFAPVSSLNGQASVLLQESITITANTTSPIVIPVSGLEIPPLAATPVASLPSGTYTSAQSVTITDPTPGAAIYYTTDGTTPSTNSTLYAGPITVMQSETLQAIAVANGYTASGIFSATYNLPLDFSVGVAPGSVTISSGNPKQVTVSITPQNTFAAAVSFTCSGLPSGATCTFAPTTVTPSGGVASTTLTLTTTFSADTGHSPLLPLVPGALAFGLCWFSLPKRRRLGTSLALIVFGLSLLPGCGGGGSSTPPHQPITATVTVNATSGSLVHTSTFSLTEQ